LASESTQRVAVKSTELAAQIEAFDSFWEGPENVEKGYRTFSAFYGYNYLKRFPADRSSRILVISCGPGYLVNLLVQNGYTDVLGIDSDAGKIAHAKAKGLNCSQERAFEFLQDHPDSFDVIFCEQEINHLTKAEIPSFLGIARAALRRDGYLFVHALNGANPITGAEALAQNFDHYNTFTEYTMRQVLGHNSFDRIEVFPLNLYVFWKNPLNYVLISVSALYTAFFRFSFLLYGKSNKIFTKKIGAVARRVG
jgi:2-polyprenyl-3-methyl-5-hydroxy-6-metoxy-1,4-benzoquinol methylase